MVHREAENGEEHGGSERQKICRLTGMPKCRLYFLVPSSSPRSISCHLTMPLRDHVPKRPLSAYRSDTTPHPNPLSLTTTEDCCTRINQRVEKRERSPSEGGSLDDPSRASRAAPRLSPSRCACRQSIRPASWSFRGCSDKAQTIRSKSIHCITHCSDTAQGGYQ
jgi:hypothetical protein